jgi:trehalose synthase
VSANVETIGIGTSSIERFRPIVGEDVWQNLEATMHGLASAMRGRVLWNINSTARGGGVVELLSSLIPYDRGCGIDERWVVIEGSPEFFNVTKRLHNLLHGVESGGSDISDEERRVYDQTMRSNAARLVQMIGPGDAAVIHDPQAAGLVPALAEHGSHVIWRSHIGVDEPNDVARSAWRMLTPYLGRAGAYVFSRRRYAWEGLDPERVQVIAPTIDPFTVKNRDMPDGAVASILAAAGIVRGGEGPATFEREDGTADEIRRRASLIGAPLAPDARIVLQVSRWDRLKDPVGLLEGFARHVAPVAGGVLVLAGPGASTVSDDPEQPEVLQAVAGCLQSLPPDVRSRVLVAQLPMEDVEENAAIVNALQRRAEIVVQKSLAEGFGLTVAEAMWKARPIVASRVGGIEDQIEDGVSGVLIGDPHDQSEFGAAVTGLLHDPERAARLGEGARSRAIREFLAPRHLIQQARLVLGLVG